jgi:hypothetical protein
VSKYPAIAHFAATGWSGIHSGNLHACNCIGPQGGRPLCPCRMRGVTIRDGRYIKPEQDLGPVVEADRATNTSDPLTRQGSTSSEAAVGVDSNR